MRKGACNQNFAPLGVVGYRSLPAPRLDHHSPSFNATLCLSRGAKWRRGLSRRSILLLVNSQNYLGIVMSITD